MSIQAVAAVLEADVGEVAAKMLLVCIANAHNSSTSICCPSIERLAIESSMGRSTVKRWLKWLVAHRYIALVERHDETGRQQSHAFRLTLTEGSNLDPSPGTDPQDVGEPELDHRGSDGEPDEGSTGEPPLKKPEEQPSSPQPPLAGGLEFAALWEVWPIEHRGNRDNAEGAFLKLSDEERRSAVASAERAAMAFRLRKGRTPALVSYLRERVFVEFDDAPKIDFEGMFVITPGRPEWGPWLGHVRNTISASAVDKVVMQKHLLVKQRWPDGHPNARQLSKERA